MILNNGAGPTHFMLLKLEIGGDRAEHEKMVNYAFSNGKES